MKKLITILTIMIVLAGAVFATEPTPDPRGQNHTTANIDVTATVEAIYPAFSLKATGDSIDAAATAAEGERDTAVLKSTVVSALATATDATVDFQILQTGPARVKNSYTLTVSATPLALVKFIDADGVEINTDPSADEIAVNTFALKQGNAAPAIKQNSLHAAVQKGEQGHEVVVGQFTAANNVLTAAYNGVVTVADLGQSNVLGAFDVTWLANANVASGKYKATVTVEIAAL